MPVDDLRTSMREARRCLDLSQQEAASIRCGHLTLQLEGVRHARSIAFYMAHQGEMSCAPLMAWAHEHGRQVLLPVVTGNRMRFAPQDYGGRLILNRWGIQEPEWRPRKWVGARYPGVVLVPLVAFDPSGNRLGQGGGYYDRMFAFRRSAVCWRRPLLVGLAHDFQRVEALPVKPTDIPLDAVVTERQVYDFRP